MKTHVVRIHSYGGPEVLSFEEADIAAPGQGEVLLRQTVVGVNFADCYQRSAQFGRHESPPLPATLGLQAAGIIEAVGPGVTGFEPGARATYVGGIGAYAERRLIAADRVVALPTDISDDIAAAGLLRGLTAEYLLRRLYRVKPGETILVHAAAGGVGLILCQWAKALGAVVIGTVGSEEKAAIARAHGCDHTVLYRQEDFVARVMAITGGAGVPVVYDSVGKDTFMSSLKCLRSRGMAINFGTASGQVEAFPLQALHQKALIVSRPTLVAWIADRAEYEAAAEAVFDVIRSGAVKIRIAGRYKLKDVARAHEDLEARRTTGSLVLDVGRE